MIVYGQQLLLLSVPGRLTNSTVERLLALLNIFKSLAIQIPGCDKIATYVTIRQEVTAAEILTNALELDPRQQGRRESRRVADVLQTMGWRRLVTSRKDPVTGKN